MPQQREFKAMSERQWNFLVQLWNGAMAQGRQAYLPDYLLTAGGIEEWARQQTRSTRDASLLADDMILGSHCTPDYAEIKPVSVGQEAKFFESAQRAGELGFGRHDRYKLLQYTPEQLASLNTWIVSKMIDKLDDHIERVEEMQRRQTGQAQPGMQQTQPAPAPIAAPVASPGAPPPPPGPGPQAFAAVDPGNLPFE